MNSQEQFQKRSDFVIRTEQPFNGNPPLEELCQQVITPNELFYVRSHGSIPNVDPAAYRLAVNGQVNQSLSLSLDDLRQGFEYVQVTATLQCAGNRREEFVPLHPNGLANQLLWGVGAVSNAVWGGWRLKDVLEKAGLQPGAEHIAFQSLDSIKVESISQPFAFGGSVPLEKLPDVLLADSMNGEPLPPVHGFPLRVVVPGYVAARSVKWLSEITLQDQPSANYYQQQDYRWWSFDPEIPPGNADWFDGMMFGENVLNSVITAPQPDQVIPAGKTHVTGYALSGSVPVARVLVSYDQGAAWTQAVFSDDGTQRWGWRLWQAVLELPPGDHTLTVRAVDAQGKSQPRQLDSILNQKGYGNNAWHVIRLKVQ